MEDASNWTAVTAALATGDTYGALVALNTVSESLDLQCELNSVLKNGGKGFKKVRQRIEDEANRRLNKKSFE